MEMLDGVAKLTLDFLNEATQAWVEIDYNRAVHREISCSPVERFSQAPDVLRSSPSSRRAARSVSPGYHKASEKRRRDDLAGRGAV